MIYSTIELQNKIFNEAVIIRFLQNLVLNPTNDCIEWDGNVQKGYGRISIGTREDRVRLFAHRWALQFALGGVILPPDIFACHHCDNTICVNPMHLFPGTHTDNMADMVAKGRSAVVKNNCNLTIEELRDIKYGREPYSYYIKKYNVAKSTVSYIRNGRTWPEI